VFAPRKAFKHFYLSQFKESEQASWLRSQIYQQMRSSMSEELAKLHMSIQLSS